MLAPKSKRKDLIPPDYVRKEWEGGDKNALADLFSRLNFDKDQGLVVLFTLHPTKTPKSTNIIHWLKHQSSKYHMMLLDVVRQC